MTSIEMTSQAGSTEGSTFTARVDAGTVRNGDHIGSLEMELKPADHRNEEIALLRAQVEELQRDNATLREQIALLA